MKAIQLLAPHRLELVELPSRFLKENEVRIQVAMAGVCGSDLKNIKKPVCVPQIPGHEFSGCIIELGGEAKNVFSVGDRVTAFPMIGCLKCAACEKGNFRDCEKKKSIGFHLPGAFAEEVIIDYRFLIRLKESISYEQGALIEHLCCGYRLMKEFEGRVNFNEDLHIVIIGDGPIALANLQALKLRGCTNVTLIGKHDIRKQLADELGASRVIDYKFIERGEWDLPRVDVCIFSASADETLRQLVPFINEGGVFFEQTSVLEQNILSQMAEKGISKERAFAYLMGDFYVVMNLIETREIKTDNIVNARFSLFDRHSIERIGCQKNVNNKVMIVNDRLGSLNF